jgi:NAD(P)-dependent dehydrogenase (short-subunit alcohol dehydrogenase family)
MTVTPLLTTGFGRESTAEEVVAGVDLTGRRAVVTGGSSGIGVETARALAAAGAEVVLAVRDLAAGERTAADITAGTGNTRVSVAPLELADPASVRAFASAWTGPLHILVNNAGVMAPPLTRTPQGWELQFATNHLGHFALATGLHAALAAAGDARIVSVSSLGHQRSDVDFDDLHWERREYDPWLGYGQSKTANILFAVEANRRWAGDGITANSLMPGVIETNLQRHQSPEAIAALLARSGDVFWKSAEQGAATSVLLAASPLLAGVGGRYFEDCNEAGPPVEGVRGGVMPYALDPERAERLWQVSQALLGE